MLSRSITSSGTTAHSPPESLISRSSACFLSTLVAAIATDAFGPKMVQAIMLPSPFTGQESLNDAKDVANLLKIKLSNLKINEAMKIIDKTLGKFNEQSFLPGITEENIQSRLRGLLLMALSNSMAIWF